MSRPKVKGILRKKLQTMLRGTTCPASEISSAAIMVSYDLAQRDTANIHICAAESEPVYGVSTLMFGSSLSMGHDILRRIRSQHCSLEAGNEVGRQVSGARSSSCSRNMSYDSILRPGKRISETYVPEDNEYTRHLTYHNSQARRAPTSSVIRKLREYSLCRLLLGGHGQHRHNHGKKSKKMESKE